MQQAQKLPFGRKLAFAVCDIFGGGSFNIINFLYPGFMALTVGLSAYHMSLIMLLARIWDAISDPLMGRISDATQSRFGKRRIYLIIAAPLILLSFFLMFYPYAFSSVTLRFLAVLVSYILFCTVQTMVMIPYYSLSSEISTDYQQRASANSLRLGFSIFSSILCVAVPGVIVDAAASKGQGYITMSLIFGVLFGASVLVTGLFAREEIHTPPVKTKMSLKSWGHFFRIRPFRQYLGMMLCLQMTMAIMSSLFFFYVNFVIRAQETAAGQSTMLGTLGAALMFAMQIVALPVYLKMIEKKGKAFTYRFGAILWIVSALCVFLVQPQCPDWQIYLLAAVMGFGISAPGLVPHTMFGDVADAIELVDGERAEGTISGIVNFLVKVVQGFGLSAVMSVLGWFGFRESSYVEEAGRNVLQEVTSQSLSAQHALQCFMALAPLVLMTLGCVISLGYRITHDKQRRISALLHGAAPEGTISAEATEPEAVAAQIATDEERAALVAEFVK